MIIFAKNNHNELKKERKNYIIAFRPWSLVASTIPALITITYIYFIKTEYSLDINLINGFLALIGAGIFKLVVTS